MSRRSTVTGADRIERAQRLASIMSLRLQGWSLRAIGESLNPACSAQGVHKCLKLAIQRMVTEATEQARKLEVARCDELQVGLYERALAGDVGAVDGCLETGARENHRR